MKRSTRTTLRILLSFAVYLIPLVGPHTVSTVGIMIPIHFTRDMRWGLADLASALLLQALFLILTGSTRPVLYTALATPVVIVAANMWFSLKLPEFFLIDKDTRPVSGNQTPVCTVDGYTLYTGRTTVPLLEREAEPKYALLLDAACRVQPLAARYRVQNEHLEGVAANGALLFRRYGAGGVDGGRLYYPPGSAEAKQFPSGDTNWVLEPGGRYAAWLSRQAGSMHGHVIDLETGKLEEYPLALPMPASWVAISFNAARQEWLIGRNEHEVWRIAKAEAPVLVMPRREPPIGLTSMTWFPHPNGYFTWDGYSDRPNYQMEWNLTTGRGVHSVLKGRAISAAAVDPTGKRIAISVSSALNLGRIQDSIYVMRTSDGSEIWRRYSSMMRSPLAFLSERHLAISTFDGVTPRVAVMDVGAPE